MKKFFVLFIVVICVVFVFWKSESEKNRFTEFNYKKPFEFNPTKLPERKVASLNKRTRPSTKKRTNEGLKQFKKGTEDVPTLKDYKLSAKQVGATPKVADLNVGGESYHLLENKFAVNAQEYDVPPAGSDKINNHYIVDGIDAPRDALRVLENAKTGGLAVFTGILKVKLSDMSQLDILLSQYDCVVENSYPHINVVLIKFSDYELTIQAHEEISKLEWVIRSEVELLEYSRGSK
ncbi:MAG: hypothetical protein CME64_12985 [Halobacteriovoraceae bacterium]|nr:hypothetical protein [Halobacteriovoraceae bacterium]|tara:strand:- start:99326 stop:100030 length:705 start_codon:yes stop_codon:yes gene_type:complete